MEESKFEKLDAWKEAHKLVLMVYKITKTFPDDEKYRLVDQLCRSASSVAANLVEGNARGHTKEFIQFAYLSRGSLEEMKYHLLLSKDLNYFNDTQYNELLHQANRVGRLINGLISYLKQNI